MSGKQLFHTKLQVNYCCDYFIFINRTFGGFASDESFKSETAKLKEILKKEENENIKWNENKVICISYDPPFKLFNRKNEVLVIAE